MTPHWGSARVHGWEGRIKEAILLLIAKLQYIVSDQLSFSRKSALSALAELRRALHVFTVRGCLAS